MKKMKIVWVGLVLTLILGSMMQSCLEDNDPYPWFGAKNYAIATIHSIDEEEKEFYFLLDGDQKLYPSDISKISSAYKWKNGQRALIYFNLFDEKVPGYEYNGEVVYISNVLTKDIIPLTEETADSIGDDRITITGGWIGSYYLNLYFEFRGTSNPKELHMVNLVRNETDGAVEDNEYLVLEFRHNAHDDYDRETLKGIVSFRLNLTEEEFEKYKGIKVRTNTINEGVQYDKFDFTGQETKVSGTASNFSDIK